jgi:histidinol-phosphate phosphatase family protein
LRQAVILAGGTGTRLRDRLAGRPKPLVEVGGVPLLERQLGLLRRHRFSSALLLVNHAADQIVDFCASRTDWGLTIECIDDGTPRGTGGATLAAYAKLAPEFLVVYGDTMFEVDLSRFHAYHAQVPEAGATLLFHPNDHPQDSDLIEADDAGRILGFYPYPHADGRFYPNLVNAALYWVRRDALAPWRGRSGTYDFARDLFPAMLANGILLRGFRTAEYIKDLGTPARLDQVRRDFGSGKIARSSLDVPQAAVFLDRDGTLNRDVDRVTAPEQLELLPGIAEAIRRLNDAEFRCCVTTNQPVVARGDCSIDELREIHDKLETLLGKSGAFLDRIYYCPHHPHRGFAGERQELKIECGCRKPKTGMIDRAVIDFNVDRERSWVIGDSSVDIALARSAGIKSVLVETGHAGLDYTVWVTPDYTAADLGSAVSFVLDEYPRLLALCREVVEQIVDGDVVLIGGRARSGKSTLASGLRDALRERGANAVALSVDRWLKTESDRTPGILGRYDLEKLHAICALVADPTKRPGALRLPGYHKIHRTSHSDVETVPLADRDILIFEGTVALELQFDGARSVHRLFVESCEHVRRSRVFREYRLRGLRNDQIEAIYQSRLDEECPVIDRHAESARRVSLGSKLL